MAVFSLKDQMTFYGAYHNNFLNQIVHVIFVPLIIWTLLVWCAYSGSLIDLKFSDLGAWTSLLPAFFHTHFSLNIGFFIFLFYGTYYLTLDFFVALSYDVILYLLFLSANAFHSAFPREAWLVAVGLHILSWFVQVSVGHYVFEKRKPALLDSLFQSLVLAPLFVYFEVIFWLGFRSEYRKELQVAINKKIVELDAKEAKQKKAN